MIDQPKRIGRPPREVPRLTVSVRFEPQELAEIDKARGAISRQDWLHGAALGVAREANKPRSSPPPKPSPAKPERTFGPKRSAPGARLKTR